MGVIQGFRDLVLRYGTSLRSAAAVLRWLGQATGRRDLSPHVTTGRAWLMRPGLAALTRPLPRADDWAWLVDHSIQLGRCRCLVVLGLRLARWPEGRPLRHEDLEPIALVPSTDWTKDAVAEALRRAAERTGPPRVILDDYGADLHGGVEIFRAAHPETVEVYDVTHRAARLLKALLKADARWTAYATALGRARFALQQTELACLMPPSQRSKARFMNVGKQVAWGARTLGLVDDPAPLKALGIEAGRAPGKLGWLADYREALAEWSGYQAMIDATLGLVRRRGLYPGVGFDLAAALPPASGGRAGALREDLIGFVRGEASKARHGERLPGTTEVLESCFGKLKSLEDSQAVGGFTGLALVIGAMVSHWTAARVSEALEQCPGKRVLAWYREHFGRSVQSQRRLVYGALGRARIPA